MARSLNKVILIGNLTRDPELRYTPQGTAVATFTIATNRQWKTDSGDAKEDAEFHRIVAWDKLAEICSQLLKKGSKAYVEGRLQTRQWQTKEGQDRTTTEIVISEMMILDSRGGGDSSGYDGGQGLNIPDDFDKEDGDSMGSEAKQKADTKSTVSKPKNETKHTEDAAEDDDIPF